MLNQTGITTKSATTRTTILVDELNSTALSCKVSSAGISAGDDGKKIIKAGTPVKGDLTNRETPFEVTDANDAVGIILHDVDVTSGTANSQVVIFGIIDISKLDTTVQALITSTIKGALKMIQFVK